jgi:energy-coupling factor transport system permease protein
VTYRRRPSPLHAARAAAAGAYCIALGTLALTAEHPLVLLAALVAVVGAMLLAGTGRELAAVLPYALPFALVVALVNPLVSREGLTVIFRGPVVPVLGALDVTLEATVYGAILGLRALVVVLGFALYATAVDPDEVLRLFRRVSFRSALTASIATRLVPVLARDARRFSDAQRCRPGVPASRLAVVRAVTTGALDRAVDVAATLEVRGYAAARRPPRTHRPWSRHDIAFTAATVALLALCAALGFGGLAPASAQPRLELPAGPGVVATCAAVVLCALLPFADRRGIVR